MRSKETAKIKKISFEIKSKMTITEMVKIGYRRPEVEALFVELHDKKLGYMIKGVRGGNPTTFFAAPCCPKIYEMSFEVFRIRKTAEERGSIETKIINDVITITIASCKNLDVEDKLPETDNDGYAIGFQDNKALLIRMNKGGYSSIEMAVEAVLDKLNTVSTFNSKKMTRVEQIASSLRGTGFIVL